MNAKYLAPEIEKVIEKKHEEIAEGFPSILQEDVPKGRDGKHKQIVKRLLDEIARLKPGTALKIPLSALPDSKENIRSALHRATHQQNINIATSSDEEHLYIWQTQPNP